VLKDEPILRDILDKGIKTVTPQERESIANKHVPINIQKGIDYTLVWQTALGGGFLLLLVLYWNRKLRALNRALERLSVTDNLTGLFNRQKLGEVFENEIQRARRFQHAFSVIVLDIDHFKQVNDTHGHQAGDQVLIAVARVLEGKTRETDTVGRWGGEEFLVICPHTDLNGARNLADKIREALMAHDFPETHHMSASFGVSTYRPGDKIVDLIERADTALYRAKHDGRNRVACETD
jgi:diguanylate cyclase (GGDEF)-like protein